MPTTTPYDPTPYVRRMNPMPTLELIEIEYKDASTRLPKVAPKTVVTPPATGGTAAATTTAPAGAPPAAAPPAEAYQKSKK